jgi:hypothetical protein
LTISSRPPSRKDSDGAQLLWIGQRHDHHPPLLRRPLLRAAVISEAVMVHHRSARVALVLNAGGSVLFVAGAVALSVGRSCRARGFGLCISWDLAVRSSCRRAIKRQ